MVQQAKIEYISNAKPSFALHDDPIKGKRNIRLKVFVTTFLVSLVVGLVINYSRPAVYSSSATLLTSAATAVDESSQDVDFQHVTIQKQKLLAADLLAETIARVKASKDSEQIVTLTISDIRHMLKVEPIEETNLLTMAAYGSTPEILPVIINTWIDVYLEARALSVKNAADDTVERIKNKLTELDIKINQTRNEIDLFRKKHDISSVAREENELPARLVGLTTALNDANEELLKSKAKLDAVNQAIASGQAVVPSQDQTSLTELEKEYRKLTATMAEFDKHFTRDYLQYKGSMKYIPEQIKVLEKKIRLKKKQGRGIVQTEARQAYYAARQVVENVRRQLDEHKIKAANFTTLFSKHQKLLDDLESMELMARETQDRLVKIESTQFEKYPQVDVVTRASVNLQAISPDYKMGLYIVFITSLCLAFFAVWLRQFLMQDSTPDDYRAPEVPVATWLDTLQRSQQIDPLQESSFIEQEQANGLPQLPTYKKISEANVKLLLDHGDNNTQQLILLLLSGLSLEEIESLGIEQVNLELSTIHLYGQNSRVIPVGGRLHKKLNDALQSGQLWQAKEQLSVEDMNAMLYCSAVDIGFDNLEQPLSEILRKSYIIYLVEQGLRLTELVKIIGQTTPVELAGYAAFSPIGGGCDIEQVNVIYPLCK